MEKTWWFWYQIHTPARKLLQPHTPVPLAQGLAQGCDCHSKGGHASQRETRPLIERPDFSQRGQASHREAGL